MRLQRQLSGSMRLVLLKTLHPHLLNHLQPQFDHVDLLLLLQMRVIQSPAPS